MATLTLDSQRQYEAMGVNIACGGVEIARKPRTARGVPPADDLGQGVGHRRRAAHARGGRRARAVRQHRHRARRLLHAERLRRRLAAGRHALPRAGAGQGALATVAGVEVLAIETNTGAVTAVVTDQGRIETEYVVIACGVWSPRIAAMAGAHIPLTPAVHQMIDVGPIPSLEATGNEIGFPIVRDMDTFCYERQTGGLDGGGLLRPPADLPPTPTTSRRSRPRACRRPSCRSPPTTSTSSSKRRSS